MKKTYLFVGVIALSLLVVSAAHAGDWPGLPNVQTNTADVASSADYMQESNAVGIKGSNYNDTIMGSQSDDNIIGGEPSFPKPADSAPGMYGLGTIGGGSSNKGDSPTYIGPNVERPAPHDINIDVSKVKEDECLVDYRQCMSEQQCLQKQTPEERYICWLLCYMPRITCDVVKGQREASEERALKRCLLQCINSKWTCELLNVDNVDNTSQCEDGVKQCEEDCHNKY